MNCQSLSCSLYCGLIRWDWMNCMPGYIFDLRPGLLFLAQAMSQKYQFPALLQPCHQLHWSGLLFPAWTQTRSITMIWTLCWTQLPTLSLPCFLGLYGPCSASLIIILSPWLPSPGEQLALHALWHCSQTHALLDFWKTSLLWKEEDNTGFFCILHVACEKRQNMAAQSKCYKPTQILGYAGIFSLDLGIPYLSIKNRLQFP